MLPVMRDAFDPVARPGHDAAAGPADRGTPDGTHPDRAEISRLLIRFYESAAASGLPEIERLATTVSTWWPEILAALTTGVTNAGSEGVNRLIKTDARCAFGYRNPANQRLRARAATTRRARGQLTTRTSGPHSQPRKHSKP